MVFANNLSKVKERIKETAINSGRSPDDVKLIAVTKMANAEQMQEAVDSGVRAIGESRVQVALEKFFLIKGIDKVEKHMIGHLQSNKVKKCVEMFDVIQSVDSLKLVNEIDKRAKEIGKIQKIMLQVNAADEEQKHGFSADEIEDAYKNILRFVNVKAIGLMCMAPYVDDKEIIRNVFRKAKEIAGRLCLKEISMGMTNDYEIAVEEGSTMVRVGRAIFTQA